jgi:lipopolysaccharide/colanic/teichoic acid biosynthesis glycosyltransferase
MMKRVFDILCSAIGILLLLPFGGAIALLIWKEDFHSPFYVQERIGRAGKLFNMYKFRSMRIRKESDLQLTVGKDPRITRIGAWIRKYKVDELPQLWNVFVGDMSLVGPRPEVEKYVLLYSPEQRQVLSVRPGITDYASLQYFDENRLLGESKDPERTYIEEIMPVKLNINLNYIPKAGIVEDIKIIFLTLKRIVS